MLNNDHLINVNFELSYEPIAHLQKKYIQLKVSEHTLDLGFCDTSH